MKLNRDTQIEEIAQAIALKGMETSAIVSQYGAKWHRSKRTILRIIKDAAPRILELQQELKTKGADTQVTAEVEAKKELLKSAIDKRLLLARIMNGEQMNERKRPVYNQASGKFEILTVYEKPDVREIIAAIAEDNKMVGDYAPTKKDVKHSGRIKTDSDKQSIREIADIMRQNASK